MAEMDTSGSIKQSIKVTTRTPILSRNSDQRAAAWTVDRFWRQEDVAGQSVNYTIKESRCEIHFLENISQAPGCWYIAKLPIKELVINKLDESESIARKRLQALKKRFKREPTLKPRYEQFINMYISLGHMKLSIPAARRRSILLFTTSLYFQCIGAIIEAACGLQCVL